MRAFAIGILLSALALLGAGGAQAHSHHHHASRVHHARVHHLLATHWRQRAAPVGVAQEGWHGPSFSIGAGSGLVAVAERYLGGNPTGWAHEWCARFLNAVVLPQAGERGTGDQRAISFARWGSPSGPQPGAIAVMSHHVGIVMADHGRTVELISGNHGHRVAIGEYPKSRIIAYRMASR